jgi:hypothetical protein
LELMTLLLSTGEPRRTQDGLPRSAHQSRKSILNPCRDLRHFPLSAG